MLISIYFSLTHDHSAYGRAGLKPGICTTSNLKVDSNQEIIVYAIRGHVIENIVKDPRIWK